MDAVERLLGDDPAPLGGYEIAGHLVGGNANLGVEEAGRGVEHRRKLARQFRPPRAIERKWHRRLDENVRLLAGKGGRLLWVFDRVDVLPFLLQVVEQRSLVLLIGDQPERGSQGQ